MKKNMGLFFGIVAIVLAALIFGGCEQSTGGGGDSPQPAAQVAEPTVDVGNVDGKVSVETGTKVTLSTATDGASIYYTLNGVEPTSDSTPYTAGTLVTLPKEPGEVTLKAIAWKEGSYSTVLKVDYTVADNGAKVPTPSVLAGGTVLADTKVELKEEGTFSYAIGDADWAPYDPEQKIQITESAAQDKVVTIKVKEGGIDSDSAVRTVEYKIGGIDWTLEASPSSGTTTAINFTFPQSVDGLELGHITLVDESGNVTKGALSGSVTNYTLGINFKEPGDAELQVSIWKDGVVSVPKTVSVTKKPDSIVLGAEADGETGKISSTFINFIFTEDVTGLDVENISVEPDDVVSIDGYTGTGYAGTLYIKVLEEGDVSVTVTWNDVENGPHPVKVYKDITPPGPVSGVSGSAVSDTEIKLTWTKPADSDFDHVVISCTATAADEEAESIDGGSGTSYNVPGLKPNTEYTFTVTAVDGDGNKSVLSVETKVKTLESAKASVTVEFSGFKEEIKTSTDKEVLSWQAGDTLTVTLEDIDGYDSCKWSLDGGAEKDVVDNEITFKANELPVKTHTLTVLVTKGVVTYTKRLTFVVGE
jgi:hypothetical protein